MSGVIKTNSANLDIINARLVNDLSLQRIQVRQGVILCTVPMEPVTNGMNELPELDVDGDWVSLAGVDLQINGALGLAFPDLSAETADQLPVICEFLWQQGVDGFLPTLVTTSVDNIQRSLATLAQFSASSSRSSQILGVHLEGPFLNPEKRGAHPSEHLLPLTVDQLKRVLGDYAAMVKVITLAPELDPTGTAIAYLRSLGIVVSLGHSQATAEQAQQAFAQGASIVTHAFNAMPGLHHRQPGLLAAAIVDPDVYCGVIADGQHISPIMLDVLLRANPGDRGLFLVSDALAPLGLADGCYPWDSREIDVKQGTARLLNGTLAGTTLPLLTGVQNLVKWQICEMGRAIALATTAPRRAIGLAADYQGCSVSALLRWSIEPMTKALSWQRLYTPES